MAEEQQQRHELVRWEDDVEESDDQVGLLRARQSSSKHRNNIDDVTGSAGGGTPAITATNIGESEPSVQEAGGGEADSARQNADLGNYNGNHGHGEGGEFRSSVCFDKLEGTESTNGVSEMQSYLRKGLNFEPSNQYEDSTKNGATVGEDADIIEEIEEELTEFDVEKVLQKQNTHDLICPNCNSHITRRVILRRRKPNGTNLVKSPKHDADVQVPDTVNVKSNNSPAVDDLGNVTEPEPEPKPEPEPEPEVFRCLSCFSCFTSKAPKDTKAGTANSQDSSHPTDTLASHRNDIPGSSIDNSTHADSSGPGKDAYSKAQQEDPEIATEPKLNLAAVNGNESQRENAQNVEKIPAGRKNWFLKNWFFSLFASDKSKKPIEQGHGQIIDVEAALVEPIPSQTEGSTVAPEEEVPSPQTMAQPSVNEDEQIGAGATESHEWDILKSIVYGGLVESITSLGVVSSAVGAGAATLNILVLGLANLIGGLFIICHTLRDLKYDQSSGTESQKEQYQQLLGRRDHFGRHATLSILSYLIFGLVPPVVYGFSFRESDDKDYKLLAVAGASLVCIILLAIGKAHVGRPPRTYFRTVLHYVVIGFMASGVSYVVGELLDQLLEKLGLFDSSSTVNMPSLEANPLLESGWASY